MLTPTFLLVGAPKCATTAICQHLASHPQVCFSRPKETYFFSNYYAKGLRWYASCFEPSPDHIAMGEGTTRYSLLGVHPYVIERISRHLNRPQIILCVRHPFDRIQSYWVELQSQGLSRGSFEQDVRGNPEYVDGSLYMRTLRAYTQAFGQSNVHTMFFEDYKDNSELAMRRCYSFLGVDESFRSERLASVVYASQGKRRDRLLTNILRRRVPFFEHIRNHSPPLIRSFVSRHCKVAILSKPSWTPGLASWVHDCIGDDIAEFLEIADRSDLLPSWMDWGDRHPARRG